MQKATFAGGCFWCLVPPYADLKGVKEIVSGFAGTNDEGKPNYYDVAYDKTDYREAVQITFDEKQVSYKELVDIFWRQIDPTDEGGQFYDRGNSYKTAIYFHDEKQKKIAEATKKEIQKEFKEPLATEIIKFGAFYKAEEEHQDFHKKNPVRYNLYRIVSGKQSYLERVWKNKIKN